MATVGGTVTFNFLCGLRGYHEYRSVWNPVVGESLRARHENDNAHDRYAIAAMKQLPGTIRPSVVGHLPREISRYTYYIILHGGRVTCQVIDDRHRRSPLIQGGLEIPVKVVVDMDANEKAMQALQLYETLVREYYKEPIDGEFEDITASVLEDLQESDCDTDESDPSCS